MELAEDQKTERTKREENGSASRGLGVQCSTVHVHGIYVHSGDSW